MKPTDHHLSPALENLSRELIKNDRLLMVLSVLLTCWIVNYFYVQGFGLYHDDWPAMADYTKLKLFNGVDSPIDWFWKWPHGRPLGWFLLSVLGAPGRMTGELIYLYLVGFIILSTLAILIFLIVERRFGRLTAIFATFLFLASPADTTRIEVTLNYIAHTGLLFSIFGIWLYQRGKTYLSYAIASLALLCYESTFFLFAAAPLLTFELRSMNTWKKQVIHGLICVALVLVISAIRYWVFDSRFAVHPNQQDKDFIVTFFLGLEKYSLHFFNIFAFGIKQGLSNLTPISAILGTIISAFLILSVRISSSYKDGYQLKNITDLFIIGFILLMAGLITSGFTDFFPDRAYGDRNTRVYLAATFGGGLIITSLIYLSFYLSRKYNANFMAFSLLFMIFLGITSNALKLQKDYVAAWQIQKQAFRSAIELSCDAEYGDRIIFMPQEPPHDKGRAIYPYGFGFSTAIADTFDWGDTHYRRIPSFMRAYNNWEKYLTLREDGRLHWDELKLSGFPVLAKAPLTPGAIIYLKGTKNGLVRDHSPIMIDGVNIIKPRPSPGSGDTCFFKDRALTGPLAPFIYPDLIALGG